MTRTLLTCTLPFALVGWIAACGDKDDDTGTTGGAAADGTDGTDGADGASDGADGAGGGTGACTASIDANTACIDLNGSDLEVVNGTAWDGQGSLEGTARLTWSQTEAGLTAPYLIIDIPNDAATGDQFSCTARPTYILYQNADGQSWNANLDFGYWGADCTVTLDSFSLTPGDEITGSFVSDAVNSDFTLDRMVGTFRATVVAL